MPDGYSTPVIHNFSFENPFAGVATEDRSRVIREISEKAAARLQEIERQLFERVRQLEPSQLLATAAFYSLHKGLGADTDFTEDGPYPQAAVEVLQSVCLAVPNGEFGTRPTLHRDLFPLLDLAKSSIDDINLQDWGVTESAEFPTPKDLASQAAKSYTRGVRNWGYPQHMRLIVTDLFDPLESEVFASVGFTVRDLLGFFDRITDVVCTRATDLLKELRPVFRKKSVPEMIAAWCELLGEDKDNEARTHEYLATHEASVEDVRILIVAYNHQFLTQVYSFTTEELLGLFPAPITSELIEQLMDGVSLPFGGLVGTPFEHLLTQSAIRLQPFVKLGDGRYFIPIPGLLNSFCLEIAENLIERDSPLWQKYLDRRSKYLETKVQAAMRIAFPEALVEANLKWTKAESGRTYETDTLVVVGPLALVCEAKSNRVSDSARRGGPDRLKRDFGNLIDKASEQASRTSKMLEDADHDVEFYRKDETVVIVPAADIRRAVCVSITLDYLPTLTLCWKILTDAGLVSALNRPTISLSLADLIVVLEVLAEPAIRLHYFWRRSECEEKAIYFGDEEDLLVYYLSNGFGTLLSTPKSKASSFYLSGNSEQLRRYYMAVWHDPDTKVPPPRRLMIPWWLKVVQRVQSLVLQR